MKPGAIFAALIILFLAVGGAARGASQNHKETLRGLTGVAIRVERLSGSANQDGLDARLIQTDAERALITTESSKRNEHVVPVIKRARIVYDVCSQITVRVEDFEIIVGNKGKNFLGAGFNPEWSGEGWIPAMVENGIWTLREDGLYHNPDGEELRLTISPEDVEALLSIRDYWKGRTITANGKTVTNCDTVPSRLPDGCRYWRPWPCPWVRRLSS